jgi:hypothetical protein
MTRCPVTFAVDLFHGRYPPGLFDLVEVLVTDEYPPFRLRP